ncbi:MAG: aldehyde dehydrogenase family protein, partial [Chloroflexota bacterium]
RAGGKAESVVINATVVDRVTPDMKLFSEESFGPVVSVIRARDTEDAIAIANNSEYGLSAAVFGRDTSRTLEVAQRIESGICHINGPTVFDDGQMHVGGGKSS